MAKYITRTIETYNTKVTFVMNNQLTDYVLSGVVGKKEAKKQLNKIFGGEIVIVSCEKIVALVSLYRMLESDFIANAEVVKIDTSSEV